MFGVISLAAMIGIVLLSDKKESSSEIDKCSREFLRDNLRIGSYSNWNIDTIYDQLKDNWVKQCYFKYLNHYDNVEKAVDELIKEGKINL